MSRLCNVLRLKVLLGSVILVLFLIGILCSIGRRLILVMVDLLGTSLLFLSVGEFLFLVFSLKR